MHTRRREIRVALVLYGGVSLAVYMHGVVQELLRFVRARRTLHPQQDDPYRRLLDLVDADAVVDVIAGSSAGGINGVLLAKALACGVNLTEVSSLWQSRADFAHLTTYQDDEEAETLLSGAYFRAELTRAFAALDQQETTAEAQELAAAVPALDLFVTATDLRGRIWQDADSRGNTIWGKDYTHYFHLRKRSRHHNRTRGYDQNQFCGAADLLARLSRATAAIPAVFGPQPWDMAEIDPDNRLDPRATVWMHDGGILDNRPFRKVMETIGARSAEGPVDRILLYVEPDPEGSGLIDQAARRRHLARPDAIDSLSGVMLASTYQAIHQHIRDLKAHNSRLNDFAAIRSMLNAMQTPPDPQDPGARAYLQLRLHHLADYLSAELAAGLRSTLGDGNAKIADAAAALAGAIRSTTEAALPALLEELDVPFYMRMLYHLIEQCGDLYERDATGSAAESAAESAAVGKAESAAGSAALGAAESAAESDVWGLLEDLRQRLWQWAHPGAPDADPACESVSRSLWEAVAQDPRRAPELLTPLRQSVSAWRKAADLAGAAPAVRIAFGEQAPCNLAALAPIYAARDMLLFPLTQAGLGERDRIELYRISPFDTLDGPPGARKVTGKGLFHFAAFLDERWRANDLLWGRLDTADILVDIIRRKAGGLSWNDAQITAIRRDLYCQIMSEERAALDMEQLFAHVRERIAARGGPNPNADEDVLRLAQLGDLQSFLMEIHTVGMESWKARRLRPAVANTMVDLAGNALAVLRPFIKKVEFWPVRWAFGGLAAVVALGRIWVRWAKPRSKEAPQAPRKPPPTG